MRGFSLIEVVVAMALLLAITAAVLTAIQTGPATLAVQSELADMQQRLRLAVDMLFRDVTAANGVRPNRWGGPSADPPETYRTDAATFTIGPTTKTYWLKTSASTDTFQLMSWDGGSSADVPVVDHVVLLGFDYLDDRQLPIATADLPGVRSIVVTLRVEAADAAQRGPAGVLFARAGTARNSRRWAPDLEVRFQATPRNLNLER